MDLRFVAFDLIARDSGLRALLVNHADRVEHVCGAGGRAPDTCFMALDWACGDREHPNTGEQLLTVRVHMPRQRAGERLFLDFVLDRLRAALAVDAPGTLITVRCLGTSREFQDSGTGTIFKTSRFEISPVAGQRNGAALLTLAPWSGAAHPGTGGVITSGGADPGMN